MVDWKEVCLVSDSLSNNLKHQHRTNAFPILQAIAAATLFGVSAPISKLLLGEIAPVSMAALLYLGSGIGLFLWRYLQKADQRYSNEARIVNSDLPWIIGAILVGGIAAPIVSVFLFRETQGIQFIISLPFMIFGAVLMLKEGHIHLHRHTEYEHEHRHCHDDLHHAHFYQSDKLPKNGYHSHIHQHETIEHRHPHTPDIHHRHIH